MKLSTPFSTSSIPNTWSTVADQKVAQIVKKASLVPRQDGNAGYGRNYCAPCLEGWRLTETKQAVIWAFGDLLVILIGVVIGYMLRI